MFPIEPLDNQESWPLEMAIRVECNNVALLKLLFIHKQHRMTFDPRFNSLSPQIFNNPIDINEAEQILLTQVWVQMWNQNIQMLLGLKNSSNSSDFTKSSLWINNLYAGNAIFEKWAAELFLQDNVNSVLPIEFHPENICLNEVSRAWKRGLRTVVTLPIEGEYFDWISTELLIISNTSRFDPRAYTAALQSQP